MKLLNTRLKNKKILLTGASGRLGQALIPQLFLAGADLSTPDSKTWDITKKSYPSYLKSWHPELVLHCAAYTDVAGAEKNRGRAVDVNMVGTLNVAQFARKSNAKFVYISSDYAGNNPMGMYAFTKLAGESFARPCDMVIRTSFKSRGTWGPNALTKVFHPVYTNADWVDIIAKKIVEAVEKELIGLVCIGTERKTLKDLALQEFSDVEEIPVEEADKLLGYHYPRDCCMKLTI